MSEDKAFSSSEMIAEMEFHLEAPDFSFRELANSLLSVEPESEFANYLSTKNESRGVSTDLRFFKGLSQKPWFSLGFPMV